MKPMPAERTSTFWSYDVRDSRSSARNSSVPSAVISYSVRGGPPTVDGAISWARSSPRLAICLSAW